MSTSDNDLLLHRYLEGTLSSEEASALNARLKEDPGLTRRLAEMSVDVLQLRDLGAGEVTEPVRGESGPPVRSAWPKGPIAAAAAILLAVGVAFVARSMQGEPGSPDPVDPPTPAFTGSWIDAVDGFEGLLSGTVVKDRREVRLVVEDVVQANERPPQPDMLVGRTVVLRPGMAPSDEGRERHDPVHEAFLRKLEPGMDLRIEVLHWRNGEFRIRALDQFQSEWVRSRREGDRERDEDRRDEPRRRVEREGEREREDSRRRGDREREGERESKSRREGDREREPEREGERRGGDRNRED